MIKRIKPVMIVAALGITFVGVAPAFAGQDRGWGPRGAPGPLAAVGLPFLIAAGAAGAYKLLRGRRAGSGRVTVEPEQS